MSIGGNPAVAGSITLDNTVENAKWKSSANANPQDITSIRLNGSTIWTKPNLQIVQNNPSWSVSTEKVTISVTRPSLINSWKYKINGGSLSSKQTSNSIAVGKDSFNEGSNTIKVYGYRDNVLKSESAEKTVTVELDVGISGTATYDKSTRKITYAATLGSSLDGWGYRAARDEGGTIDVIDLPVDNTTDISDLLTVAQDGTWTITFKGYKNDVERSTFEVTVVVATPFIEITSVEELTPAAPPTLAVGTMVGVIVSIDHQDRNDDEDSECYTRGVFFEDFDTLYGSKGEFASGTLPYLNHPTGYWYYSGGVWDGVGGTGNCSRDNNANLEHTATMDGVTYKIRYRQILNSAKPSGITLNLSDVQVNLVTSSTRDAYHSFLSASYMQAFYKIGNYSRNHNYIEAYIYSVS